MLDYSRYYRTLQKPVIKRGGDLTLTSPSNTPIQVRWARQSGRCKRMGKEIIKYSYSKRYYAEASYIKRGRDMM